MRFSFRMKEECGTNVDPLIELTYVDLSFLENNYSIVPPKGCRHDVYKFLCNLDIEYKGPFAKISIPEKNSLLNKNSLPDLFKISNL
jgi:hypothetical protein